MRVDYREYLKGRSESLEELAIFEIGGSGGGKESPIVRFLSERNARQIIYREINDPRQFSATAHYLKFGVGREVYRPVAKKWIEEHELTDSIDMLSVPWDAADVPYPFDMKFDEFHCHLLLAYVVERDRESLGEYAAEIQRLLKKDGRVFLGIQPNNFFVPGYEMDFPEFVGAMESFAGVMEHQGFEIDVLHYRDDLLFRHVKDRKKYHAGETGNGYCFSNWSDAVGAFLIATNNGKVDGRAEVS